MTLVGNRVKPSWDLTTTKISQNWSSAKHWVNMNYSYYFNYDNYRDLKNKEFQVGINLLIDKERKIEENIKKIEINIKMN